MLNTVFVAASLLAVVGLSEATETDLKWKDIVNCKKCPYGFFDGCNNCGCGEGGLTFCTKRACFPEQLGEPSCNKPPPMVDCEKCPNGFFDGCNNCGCNEDGFAICTLRACSPEELREPTCNEPPPPPPPPVDCERCPNGFFDGCNTCGCERGIPFCTLRFCTPEEFEEPVCNKPPPPPPPPVDCKTCPFGFFDGCNTCGCEGDLTFCTLRFCTPEEFEEPFCNDPPVGCETCPSGRYFDGCNTCSCPKDSKPPICTYEKACLVQGTPACIDDCDPKDDKLKIELWDAKNDKKISDRYNWINACRWRHVGLTLVAKPKSKCKKEKLRFKVWDRDQKKTVFKKVDKESPFSLSAGRGDDHYAATILKKPGNYTLFVTPNPGETQKFRFKVVDKCW